MLWVSVGVHEDDGEGAVAFFFMSLSTASKSVVNMRNYHENKIIVGYEPGV